MNIDWSIACRLRSVEFLACWHALDLSEPPPVLGLRPPGATEVERDRAYRQALRRAGAGHHEPRLASMLQLIASPTREYDLRTVGQRGELIALGSVSGEHGVVTVRRAEVLTLLPTSGPAVPGVLVELAGPLQPGRARAVNMAAEAFDRACAGAPDLWTAADRLATFGMDRGEANSVARMLSGITGGGQLGATAVFSGTRHRGSWVIGYHHTCAGDFTQFRRANTVTIAPITPQRLFAQLHDLTRDLPQP